MAGLALGNALVGWYAPRIRHFLLAYAVVELIVAFSGIGLTQLLTVLPGWLAPATHAVLDTRWEVNLVRASTAFALLVVPTTAMGAAFPLTVAALSRSPDRFGPSLGRLYGLNTLGGVVGVLVAELLMIDRLGVTTTASMAGLLDVVAAGAALLAASRERALATALAPRCPRPTADGQGAMAVHNRTGVVVSLLCCAFVMGTASMALEVVWFRFLSMFLVASTLAVAVMLAVALSGIAVGGLIGSSWVRDHPDAPDYLASVAWIGGCTVVASYAAFRFLFGGWAAEWYRMMWAAIALMWLTSTLSGVAFVLLGVALKRYASAGEATTAAWLTLANTAGGIVGPLAGAFVLLPVFGIERSLFALASAYVAAGLIAVTGPAVRARSAHRVRALAGVAAAASLALFPFGSMASAYSPRVTASYRDDGARLVATREGVGETIHLLAKSWLGKPLYYRLVTNGFSMSGTHLSAKRYMGYFAYWPMILRENPLRRALVLCYGAGVTTAAAASIRSVNSIDVVELSPDIVAMSRFIYASGHRPLDDPRVRLHLEDARYFLQATSDRFDLITGEPPPPLTPGAVTLYTREYFTLVRNRLAEGGVATYWLPVARRGEYDVRAIIAAFCDVFDDCSLWNGTVFDWMLVGTRDLKPPTTEAAFGQPWQDPVVWPRLREIGFELPQEIGATFLGDRDDLVRLSAGVAPVTDDYPQRLRPRPTKLALTRAPTLVERDASDFVAHVTDPVSVRQRFERSALIRRLWPKSLALETLPYFDVEAAINRVMWEGPNAIGRIEELHGLLTRTSLRRAPLWALGSDDAQQEAADAGRDDSGSVDYVLGIRAMVARQYLVAAQSFADAQRRGFDLPALRPLMVYSLCLAGNLEAARRLAEAPAAAPPEQRHFWQWLDAQFSIGAAALQHQP